jgi:hypothetical protein
VERSPEAPGRKAVGGRERVEVVGSLGVQHAAVVEDHGADGGAGRVVGRGDARILARLAARAMFPARHRRSPIAQLVERQTVNQSADSLDATPQASGVQSPNAVPAVYPKGTESGGFDLSMALSALASSGLPPDALAAAVEALLKVARAPTAAAPTAPRLVGGA